MWNRHTYPGAHVCCEHSDNIVLSQAHGLLGGVTAACQAKSETAQSITDSPVCGGGTAYCSSSKTFVPVLYSAQVLTTLSSSCFISSTLSYEKLDDFLVISGRL